MHVGTLSSPLEERDRPDLAQITTFWRGGAAVNKGDALYDREKFDFPSAGFVFKLGK